MMQRIGVSRHQYRIFLANEAIALGWALRGSCNACAHRLVACARWLVPEAQRFLVHRTGSHSSLLHHMQPLRVVAGLLIVLVLLGSLDFVTRAIVRRSPELAQGPIFEPVPFAGTQLEAVLLPTKKPRLQIKSRRKRRTQPLRKEWLSEKARSAERDRQGLAVASRLWQPPPRIGALARETAM